MEIIHLESTAKHFTEQKSAVFELGISNEIPCILADQGAAKLGGQS